MVVVDILRATSVMVTALANGAKSILPVASLEEAKCHLNKEGYLCAAERGGEQVEGFPLDNSPYSYMNDKIKGACLVITTTNGTLALSKSTSAKEVLAGAFVNLTATSKYLMENKKDVIIHCAGWKGKTNMEDTLFAGALVEKLMNTHEMGCDTPRVALNFYQSVKHDLLRSIKKSSHAKRLNRLNIDKDIEFCARFDQFDIVPVLKEEYLISVD